MYDSNAYNITIYLGFSIYKPIEFVNLSLTPVIKFTGVLFDTSLNFKAHINSVSSKILKSLYVIHTAKNCLTHAALKALYYF
jgi:hypothetical protein